MKFLKTETGHKKHLLSVAGVIMIISGITGSIWVCFFSTDHPQLINLADLVLLFIPLILIGLYLITFKKFIKNSKKSNSAYNFVLIIFSILFSFILLEIVLRTGVLDNKDSPAPVWIPYKYKQIDEEIKRSHMAYSKHNPHKFNDKPRPYLKKPGNFRIAVLGDSFIWGDGVPYEVIWSHILERKIKDTFKDKLEVFSWGCRGWSTSDQFRFFKECGIKYQIDLLIIAFVDNDPDMGDFPQVVFKINQVPIVWPFRALLPNAVDFFSDHVEALANKWSDTVGYEDWLNNLYSSRNLQEYSQLLKDFSKFCQTHNVKLLFILTPMFHSPSNKVRFNIIKPLLVEASIQHYDLWGPLESKLEGYKLRELWANPANPHPGALQTQVYAEEVFKILKENYIKR